ncbi:TfuA-like protein [Mesorhizobium sp. CA12]|uniref:TfuA-like protein n=1 Tax=Mesorhizobium sp. CA12 TaxID=2876644 RepID=UPI001CCE47AE|nr:TfuA-like protein [Mesorhizobium sp. CA12]MBZ9863526.1 TfuA-like core domain-containing protein [Mesorhizobium sp. CA12]
MRALVFAGPSLHGTGVCGGQDFDIARPARCGDLMRAALEGRKVIGLIDGVFESGPAVWHKEILFALDAGCNVLGAASMGALRAAECWQFGMIGIGRVFEDYRWGRRIADADVAVLHGPAEIGHLPLTVPLVDVADVVERMLAVGVLDEPHVKAVMAVASRTHFKSRTWKQVLAGAGLPGGLQQAALDWIVASGPALKTRDALLLIDSLGKPPPHRLRPGVFLHTPFSARLLDQVRN